MPFFVDGEEVQSNREIMEALKDYGDLVVHAMAYSRCPMCGCDLGHGGYDMGYGDYQEVEYCMGECGYEDSI